MDTEIKNKPRLLTKVATAPLGVSLALLFGCSLLMNLLLEILGRRSAAGALSYMVSHPLLFLYNSLIILFTMSLCLFAKKRLTVLLLVSTVWMALGVTNFIVLAFRSSPLSAIDFLIVKAALGMFSIYLSTVQIVLICAALLAFIGVMILLHIKCPKCRVIYHRSAAVIAVVGLVLWGFTVLATETNAIEPDGELADAYGDYGFAYCFTRSLLSHGVDKPDDYTQDKLGSLIEKLEDQDADSITADTENVGQTPNIIFVQLESFFDVRRIKWLECSEDPTPTFNSLREKNGVYGYLRVENFGGGTANTEFEVLTGMNLDHFGFGEYPYTTVLKSRACESVAANLKALGYGTHAIHNHTAVFYDRNVAYSNLGFDSFTPVEMMNGVTYNPLGWERDDVMTSEIISALDSTDGPDLVFGVTVQGHGKYPSEPLDPDAFGDSYAAPDDYDAEKSIITVSGTDDPAELSQLTYYVNQLRETDDFIKALITALEQRGEPCVVVFYGDHLPALALSGDDLCGGTLYDTEYAVWTNTGLFDSLSEPLTRDIEAYMLSAYIQSLCGMSEGTITKLHQLELADGQQRDDELKMLEYSQLYDNDRESFKKTDMAFGTRPVIITGWSYSDGVLEITGNGFNQYSTVKSGGFSVSTSLVDENTLRAESLFWLDGEPEVYQLATDGTELARAVVDTDKPSEAPLKPDKQPEEGNFVKTALS